LCRHEEIYHLEGLERKVVNKDIRYAESSRANILKTIAVYIHKRRLKEWAVRVLRTERVNRAAEQKRNEEAINEADRSIKMEQHKNYKLVQIKQAKEFDKKWIAIEASHQKKLSQLRYDAATLKNIPEYTLQNPYPKVREHPLSWRLNQYDKDGNPVGTDAINKVSQYI
jgi:ATP-dependent Clp protease ATP-binding subunit ClpA